jgi:hypothetical protein
MDNYFPGPLLTMIVTPVADGWQLGIFRINEEGIPVREKGVYLVQGNQPGIGKKLRYDNSTWSASPAELPQEERRELGTN